MITSVPHIHCIVGDSPSCYVMYKFYTFPDHDTPIIAHSSSPVFDNQQTYPLSMDQHLDVYLKTEVEVYVPNFRYTVIIYLV